MSTSLAEWRTIVAQDIRDPNNCRPPTWFYQRWTGLYARRLLLVPVWVAVAVHFWSLFGILPQRHGGQVERLEIGEYHDPKTLSGSRYRVYLSGKAQPFAVPHSIYSVIEKQGDTLVTAHFWTLGQVRSTPQAKEVFHYRVELVDGEAVAQPWWMLILIFVFNVVGKKVIIEGGVFATSCGFVVREILIGMRARRGGHAFHGYTARYQPVRLSQMVRDESRIAGCAR